MKGVNNPFPILDRPPHLKLAPHAVLLKRPHGEIQVGLDSRTALIFAGPGFADLLTALQKAPTSPVALAGIGQAAGLTAHQVTWALQRLADAGLLNRPASLIRRRVRLVGAGPIGLRLAGYLLASGLFELCVFDDQPPEVDLYPAAGVLADRAAALADALTAPLAGPARVVPLAHWSKPETLPIDLTVLVSDGPEVDRVITDHLLRLDQPHLLVRSLGDAAWVGPLVLPGRTSCVRCADLTRRDADSAWPMVLAQLGRLRVPVPDLLSGWAASVAATQALAFLDGRVPEAAGATLELTADLSTELRGWPVHRECGCGWAVGTEWGP
jgi:DNA-binding MarR family transcriptional regulator